MPGQNSLIAPHGGYKNLKSFQATENIYDLTVKFCRLYLEPKSRTNDQMVQAARSGKQNIAEGSQTSGTSKQSELRLLDVARASLVELLEDYQDFLRQRNLRVWGKDDPRVLEMRQLAYRTDRSDRTNRSDKTNRTDRSDRTNRSDKTNRTDRSDRTNRSDRTDRSDRSYASYKSYLTNPESAANCAITLINQANYLLDRQIEVLQKDLGRKGDLRERIREYRKKELLGGNFDLDEFLRKQGFRRLEDGRVVKLDE